MPKMRSTILAFAAAAVVMSTFGAGAATAAPATDANRATSQTNMATQEVATPPQMILGSFVKFTNDTPDSVFVSYVGDGTNRGKATTPQILHPGQGIQVAGSNPISSDRKDVRIRVYEAIPYPKIEGHHHLGRMLMVVTAENSMSWPKIGINMDPFEQDGKMYNKVYRKNMGVKDSYDFTQSGTRTHAHREIDSPDHKVFIVKIQQLPSQPLDDHDPDPTGGVIL